LFLNHIKRSELVLNMRNSLNIKPIPIVLPKDNQSYSISDAFCWRKCSNFETNFRYTDLLNYFIDNTNNPIKLLIFNHNSQILNTIDLSQDKICNNIDINKVLKNNKDTSGHFFIFHKFNKQIKENFVIRNSCYTSFSFKGGIPNIVHGNLPVVAENEFSVPYKKNIIQYSYFKNYKYKVQHNFIGYEKVEIFLFNPVQKKLQVFINNMSTTLNAHTSKIISLPKSQLYTIKSKCLLLRPIFFVYKNNNFDAFHG
jgi:hypothetical protein